MFNRQTNVITNKKSSNELREKGRKKITMNPQCTYGAIIIKKGTINLKEVKSRAQKLRKNGQTHSYSGTKGIYIV